MHEGFGSALVVLVFGDGTIATILLHQLLEYDTSNYTHTHTIFVFFISASVNGNDHLTRLCGSLSGCRKFHEVLHITDRVLENFPIITHNTHSWQHYQPGGVVCWSLSKHEIKPASSRWQIKATRRSLYSNLEVHQHQCSPLIRFIKVYGVMIHWHD